MKTETQTFEKVTKKKVKSQFGDLLFTILGVGLGTFANKFLPQKPLVQAGATLVPMGAKFLTIMPNWGHKVADGMAISLFLGAIESTKHAENVPDPIKAFLSKTAPTLSGADMRPVNVQSQLYTSNPNGYFPTPETSTQESFLVLN